MASENTPLDCLLAISEVAAITGVKPVTLRAWQRRYNLLAPQRTPKGHRLYCAADIQRIEQIQNWLQKGVSIGNVKPLLDKTTGHDTDAAFNGLAVEVETILAALAQARAEPVTTIMAQVLKEYPFSLVRNNCVEPVYQALGRVKYPRRSLQIALFDSVMVSKLELMLSAMHKRATKRALLVVLDNERRALSLLEAATLAEQGWSVFVIDGIDDLQVLLQPALAAHYDCLCLHASKPITRRQLPWFEQLHTHYRQVVLSPTLSTLQNSEVKL